MVDLIKKPESGITQNSDVRKAIQGLERFWMENPDHIKGDDWVEALDGDLTHQFINGLYVRMVRMPKDMVVTTKIHKVRHPFFVLKGRCKVMTEEGVVEIAAPYMGITEPGTKRLIHVLEECVWYTIHATDKTTPEEVEEEVIAKDFTEIEFKHENTQKET
jgi:mannose-6-phosphate isomerase-like protein (cupin superfamily)